MAQGEGSGTTDLRPDRILVRAPTPLGDAVMAEPAIRAIAARFPEAHLTVHVRAPLAPLARAWSVVDTILPLYVGPWLLERLDRLRVPRRLSHGQFDLCVLLPNSWESADLVARARIPKRVGYARYGREPLLTDPVPTPAAPRGLHMVAYYWGLATQVGCGEMPGRETLDAVPAADVPGLLGQDPRTAPRVEPSDAMLEAGAMLLDRAGLGGRPFVAVAPGADFGSAKRWPAESFGALCRALGQEPGLPSVLLGSRGEKALGAAVRRHVGPSSPVVDLTGLTDLGALLGVLARADLFIGNDSGPAHLAAALGRPGVTLFGSTSERHSGPVGPRMRTLHREMPCSPCFERVCPLGHHDCLRGLSVAGVVEAARQAVAGRR